MSRLTKDLRADIVRNALKKAGVIDELAEIEKHRTDWAEAVRVDACGGPEAVKKIAKSINAWKKIRQQFPRHLYAADCPFREDDDIYLNVAGRRFRAKFSNYENKRPCPNEHTLMESHHLTKEFFRLEQAEQAARAKESEICANVNATLNQFHTIERLVKAWPEVAELLPSAMPERAANLPMVPVATLNKLVGLPSEKPKAKKK